MLSRVTNWEEIGENEENNIDLWGLKGENWAEEE